MSAMPPIASSSRFAGPRGQRDPGLLEEPPDAGDAAAAVVVLELGVPNHQHGQADAAQQEREIAGGPDAGRVGAGDGSVHRGHLCGSVP